MSEASLVLTINTIKLNMLKFISRVKTNQKHIPVNQSMFFHQYGLRSALRSNINKLSPVLCLAAYSSVAEELASLLLI